MKLEIMNGEKTSAAEQPSVTVIQVDFYICAVNVYFDFILIYTAICRVLVRQNVP